MPAAHGRVRNGQRPRLPPRADPRDNGGERTIINFHCLISLTLHFHCLFSVPQKGTFQAAEAGAGKFFHSEAGLGSVETVAELQLSAAQRAMVPLDWP